jgi:hypothetical protein
MKYVHRLKDIKKFERAYPKEFYDYIKEEFFNIYDYLSNGEKVEDFKLLSHESLVILEEEKELKKILQNQVELEFVEEFELESINISRIGLMKSNEVQLCYFFKLKH